MRTAIVSGVIMLAAGLLIAPYVRMLSSLTGGGLACHPAAKHMARLELLFGSGHERLTPIGEEEWAAFMAAEITPRFPNGLTVLTGYGQWRDISGTLVREACACWLSGTRGRRHGHTHRGNPRGL